jgi:hypothetical protein
MLMTYAGLKKEEGGANKSRKEEQARQLVRPRSDVTSLAVNIRGIQYQPLGCFGPGISNVWQWHYRLKTPFLLFGLCGQAEKMARLNLDPRDMFKAETDKYSKFDDDGTRVLQSLVLADGRYIDYIDKERRRERGESGMMWLCVRLKMVENGMCVGTAGVPTHDAAGEPLSKSAFKKLKKDWDKQKKLFEKVSRYPMTKPTL